MKYGQDASCPYFIFFLCLFLLRAHLVFGAELGENLVHAEKLIEGIIEEKLQLGYFAQLLSNLTCEGVTKAVDVFIHGSHDFHFILRIENGEIHLGALQIRGDYNAGDSDHGSVIDVGTFIQENHTELSP